MFRSHRNLSKADRMVLNALMATIDRIKKFELLPNDTTTELMIIKYKIQDFMYRRAKKE